ncbi:MAG: hypothetical protein J5J06_16275 [Phycisphaerae bacterium]|nr:hypothetical protein [Phycisphaerae bacterium]
MNDTAHLAGTRPTRVSIRTRLLFVLLLWTGMAATAELAARLYIRMRGYSIQEVRRHFDSGRTQRSEGLYTKYDREYPYLPFVPRVSSPDIEMKGLRLSAPGEKKPDDVFRVVCLGGSTTFLGYPAKLEDALRALFEERGLRLEVVNAACISWTSAESLINLTMRCLPLDPDLVIVLHATNDGWPAFGRDYRQDYAHWRARLARPEPVFWDSMPRLLDHVAVYVQIRAWFYQPHQEWTWVNAIMRYVPDFEQDPYHGMDAFRRHMTNILAITRQWQIPTILVTQTGNRETEIKGLLAAMDDANEITRSLAAESDQVDLVDAAAVIRGDNQTMYDICHLKPEAEAILVDQIGAGIRRNLPDYLRTRSEREADRAAALARHFTAGSRRETVATADSMP